MAAVTASYTNLCPYRKHVIRLDIVTQRMELLSDPLDFQVSNSGLHGNHNWYPRCRVFTLRDFSYMGTGANRVHDLHFWIDGFSVRHGVWRYIGFPLTRFVVPARAVAEIIFWGMDHPAQPLRPPPRPPYTAAEIARTTLHVVMPQQLPQVSESDSEYGGNAPTTALSETAPLASEFTAPSETAPSETPSASSTSLATSFSLPSSPWSSSPTALGSGAASTDSSWLRV